MSFEKSMTIERGNTIPNKLAGQSMQKLETIRERVHSIDGENDESTLLRATSTAQEASSSMTTTTKPTCYYDGSNKLLDEYYSYGNDDDDDSNTVTVNNIDNEQCSSSHNQNDKDYTENSPLMTPPTPTTKYNQHPQPTLHNSKRFLNNINDGKTQKHTSVPSLLPKTFTEPANLSELLKNVSSNFNRKFFASRHAAISPSESLISVDAKNLQHKKIDASAKSATAADAKEDYFTSPPASYVDGDEDDNRDDYGYYHHQHYDDIDATIISNNNAKVGRKNLFKPILLQGASSFHLRQKDYSSKVNDICGQCPRCSKYGRLNSLHPTVGYFDDDGGQCCPCRICLILNPATSPSLVSPSFDAQELGALCQLCGQNGNFQTNGRCSRYNTSLTTAALSPDIADGCEIAVNNGLVTSASVVGAAITCREQGVQVSKWSLSSVSSCSGPLCRICHSPGDKIESLMSPCRCSGSLKYVHMSCLLRWLEISRRKLHRAPHCELCGYKYQRHKIMRFRRFQCPPCSRRDKFLHITFVLSILIMIVCACTTIICFKSERPNKSQNDKIELTGQEIVTLVCGVMFFCAFFLAMYVQVKAQATIYKLLLRFWLMNQEWQIEDYRRDRDAEFRDKYNNKTESNSCSSV